MATSHIGRRLQEMAMIEIEEKMRGMASGAAADFSMYRYMCGVIDGMRQVVAMVDIIEGED